MRKTLYIVRHCVAAGQLPEAALTADGHLQAEQLARQLAALPIDRIISSPFVRAKQSIAPLAERLDLPITSDKRFAERVLATGDLTDWLAALKSSFDDLDRGFAGGESSRAAMQRASEVVSEVMAHPADATVLVTHGNLMTLLLKQFDARIGFAEWQQLTHPDVYRIKRAKRRTRSRGSGRFNPPRTFSPAEADSAGASAYRGTSSVPKFLRARGIVTQSRDSRRRDARSKADPHCRHGQSLSDLP